MFSITDEDPSNANCIEHWRANEYDALGRLKQERLGAIVTTTRAYDQGQGVLNSIQAVLNVNDNATVQSLSYQYDTQNNVTSIINWGQIRIKC